MKKKARKDSALRRIKDLEKELDLGADELEQAKGKAEEERIQKFRRSMHKS